VPPPLFEDRRDATFTLGIYIHIYIYGHTPPIRPPSYKKKKNWKDGNPKKPACEAHSWLIFFIF